ncbi:MAG: tRNA 2-thiocytidine(32) synthetase TtcA, partial [Bacteroidaceae bacterium]|nr:tRNA 2-thiocytidine(32) synthetase TtcA [Bacteroidaceae bacterium]
MTQPLKLTEAYRTEQRVKRRFAEAVRQFGLIEPGDRLLVGLSGGKDSLALLELLADYRRRCPFEFEVKALHVRMQGIDYLTDTSYLEDMASQCGVTLLVRTAS